MKKNLIIALVSFLIGFTQISKIIAAIVLDATRELPLPDLLWLSTGRIIVLLPFIIAAFFAYKASKTTSVSSKKTRIFSIILLCLSILVIFFNIVVSQFWQEIAKVNSGSSTSELAERARDPDSTRIMAMNAGRATTMMLAERFLADFYDRKGNYPANVKEFETDWDANNFNVNKIEWGYYKTLEYHVSADKQQYVLRVQLGTDYHDMLTEIYDVDGNPLNIDCSDEHLYLCHTEDSPKRF